MPRELPEKSPVDLALEKIKLCEEKIDSVVEVLIGMGDIDARIDKLEKVSNRSLIEVLMGKK